MEMLSRADVELFAERCSKGVQVVVEAKMDVFIAGQRAACTAHQKETATLTHEMFGDAGVKPTLAILSTKSAILFWLVSVIVVAVVGGIVAAFFDLI